MLRGEVQGALDTDQLRCPSHENVENKREVLEVRGKQLGRRKILIDPGILGLLYCDRGEGSRASVEASLSAAVLQKSIAATRCARFVARIAATSWIPICTNEMRPFSSGKKSIGKDRERSAGDCSLNSELAGGAATQASSC